MEQIGKYKILAHIGHGAMGSVEKAEAPDGTIVAIKTLFPQFVYEDEYVKRFKREAELAKKLSHPNVVKIIEIGEDNEGRRQYIVMEYIDGKTLAESMHDKGMASIAIKRSSKLNQEDESNPKDIKASGKTPKFTTFTAEETIRIIRQLAGVLQAANDIGLLHRDVKPQNILLDKKGNAKLLDFGLAKDTEALVSMLSMTGQSIGTPPYMSPEQHDGQNDIDIRSDLYSLGCTAYQMLTGKAPFPGPTITAFARQHCDDIPEPVHKVNPDCPLNLSQLIDRLLAKKPKDRHQSPAELIEDLNRVERGEVPLKLYKPKKSKKHNPVRNWLTVAAAVIIVAGCFMGWNYYRSSNAATIISKAMSDARQMAVKHNFDSAKERLDNIISEYATSKPELVKEAESLRTTLIEQQGKWLALEAARKRREAGTELTRAEVTRKRKLYNYLRNAARLKNQENHVKEAETLINKAYQLCNSDAEREKIATVEKKVREALTKIRPWAAVADFTLDKSVEAKLTGSAVAVKLEQALGQKYRLVTRNQVRKALKELRFQSSDLADKSKAQKFGKLVGAEYLISGSVIQLGREITVACQIFSIETGAIRQTAEVSASDVNDFNYMIRDAAKILAMSNAEKVKYVEKLNSSKRASGGKYPKISQDNPSYEKNKIIPGLGIKLVYVAPGSFMMGSNDGQKDEKPVHKVTISNAYWIGKYEVTQKEYQAIMGNNPSVFQNTNNPVENVTWNEAAEFCKKINEQEKKAGRLPDGYEYRLPTEAEWEFAARGGNYSKGYVYSGSNEIDKVVWYYENSGDKKLYDYSWSAAKVKRNNCRTHEVGMKAANELGIHDMNGNVKEWCIDFFGNYPDTGVTDPFGTGSYHAYRSGSWANYARCSRIADRGRASISAKYRMGIRIALAPCIVDNKIALSTSINKIIPGLNMKLVLVKPGSFMMGSDAAKAEKPIHKVTISKEYWIGKYEVTQNEYKAVMGINPSYFNSESGNRPVEQTSWNDAANFCQKLTEREEKAGRLPDGYEYRLPTEAEWEFAARGGNKSQGYIYSGSNNLDSVGWYASNSSKQTQRVGSKAANELGIHDMSGNVWEWCMDSCNHRKDSMKTDSYIDGIINPLCSTGDRRITRGGSFSYTANCSRIAIRGSDTPDKMYYRHGFRVALAPVIVDGKIKTLAASSEKQTAIANPLDKTVPELGMKLIHVEPGSFTMGSDREASSKPLRKVKITKEYWIGKYEVTQHEYKAVMGTNPSRYTKAKRPVERVSWNDAVEFCQKLTEQEKKAKRLPDGYEFRLPTEAEWEFAARGGNKSKGYTYSGSNDVRSVAWNKHTAKKRPHEVGGKAGNELGIHDMSGNVYEWCLDNWHDNYSKAPLNAGPWLNPFNDNRVYRGGGFLSPSRWSTATHRSHNIPDMKVFRLGFRVVLAPVVKTIHAKVPDKVIPDLGMKLVYVAPGSFEMGSNNGRSTEKPVHKVNIYKAYWIGKYEVTQKEYQMIMGNNPSHFKGDNKPVEKVSWHTAMDFCKKLTERERKAGRLPKGYTYQLPTEAEWEFAAHGGNKSKNSKYSGSDNLAEVAWTAGNSGKQTHEIGKKSANELGIHDMNGNVYEWCRDNWHSNYTNAPSSANCWGKGNAMLRVRRGGGWHKTVGSVTHRSGSPPSRKYAYMGFRVALSAYHAKPHHLSPVSKPETPVAVSTPPKTIIPQIKSHAPENIKYKELSETELKQNIIDQKRIARKRMYADMRKYSKKENEEIESLYQSMYKLKDPEKSRNLRKLIAKYPRANRSGCAALYLAYYMKGDAQRIALLKVIRRYGGCYYGDGANVAACAKLFLARYYLKNHNLEELKSLFNDLIKNHPAAIHHNRKNIVSLVKDML